MTNEFNPDGKDIRFIDSHYKDLFRVPDGGCIQIHYPDETVVKPCKFIDEYHTQIGNNVFHICQFAEIMERKADMFTKRTIKPERRVTSVDTPSEALAISMGERGKVELPFMAQL